MECGAGVKALQNQRLAEARSTGADWLVTACPKCDIHFGCAIADGEYHGPAVKNVVDILAEALGVSSPKTAEAQVGTGARGCEGE